MLDLDQYGRWAGDNESGSCIRRSVSQFGLRIRRERLRNLPMGGWTYSEIAARCTGASNPLMGCCDATIGAKAGKAGIGFLGEIQSGVEQEKRNGGSAEPSRRWELGFARAEVCCGR